MDQEAQLQHIELTTATHIITIHNRNLLSTSDHVFKRSVIRKNIHASNAT